MGSCANIVKYGKKIFKKGDWKTSFNPKNWDWQKIVWPFRVLTHPIQAFNEIKYEKKGSMGLACVVLALWFFSKIFEFLETGFVFNKNDVNDLDSFMLFMSSAMVVILMAIGNWAICTLMDGEGWFKDIFITFSYCVMPQVVTIIPMAVVSNFLTIDEQAFMTLFGSVSFLWMVLLILIANTIIHQYSFGKSIAAMLLTIFGVLILLLIFVLVVSLVMQVYGFVDELIDEIRLRIG